MKHVLSASQVATHRQCGRKLLWRFVVGVKEPKSNAMAFGSEVHAVYEGYLKTGLFDFQKHKAACEVLAPALPHLPKFGSGARSEEKFEIVIGGLPFVGFVDAVEQGTVYDLKTTSKATYAKDKTTLTCDVQPVVYMQRYKDEASACRWVYTLTKGARRAWPVDFEPPTSGPVLDQLVVDGTEIARGVCDKISPLSVPPAEDPAACHAYGGCYYRQFCTDLQPLRGLGRAGKEPNFMSVKDMIARLKQSQSPADVNPPESSLAGAPPLPPAPEEKPKKTAKKPKKTASEEAAPEVEGESKQLTLEDAMPKSVVPDAERQRLIAEFKEKEAAKGQYADTPTNRHIIEHKSRDTDPAPPNALINVLYIDCLPDGVQGADLVDLSYFIKMAHDAVREQFGVLDYRLIDYKGAGFLSAAFFATLKDTGVPDVAYIDSTTAEARAIMNDLCAMTVTKVRPTRG